VIFGSAANSCQSFSLSWPAKPAPNWWKRYTNYHFQEFHHVTDGVQIEAQFWKALASTENSPRAPFHHVMDGVQIEAQFWKALESAENSPALSLSLATLNLKVHDKKPSTDLHLHWYLVRIIICFWGWLCVLWTKLPIDVWQFIMGATEKRIEGLTLLWWWRFLETWRSSEYIYAQIVAAKILYWKPKVLRGSRACATRWNLLGERWR
jgi:hypothetical protein